MNVSLTRFEKKFTKRGIEMCWLWRGKLDADGYGRFQVKVGWAERAHRYAWELYRGPIPSGRAVLHSCGRKACVNPTHLYLASKKSPNYWANRTMCPQGHPYKGKNLYIDPSGRRRCRACARKQVREFNRKEKS